MGGELPDTRRRVCHGALLDVVQVCGARLERVKQPGRSAPAGTAGRPAHATAPARRSPTTAHACGLSVVAGRPRRARWHRGRAGQVARRWPGRPGREARTDPGPAAAEPLRARRWHHARAAARPARPTVDIWGGRSRIRRSGEAFVCHCLW